MKSILDKKESDFKCTRNCQENNYHPHPPEPALLLALLTGEALLFLKDTPSFPQLREPAICPRRFKGTVGKAQHVGWGSG